MTESAALPEDRQQQEASQPHLPSRQQAATDAYTGLPYAQSSMGDDEEDEMPGMRMFDD